MRGISVREATCRNCCTEFAYESGGGLVRPLCGACEETHKWCPSCGYALVHLAFRADVATRGGLEGQCAQCKRSSRRAQSPYAKRLDPRRARALKILTRYGLNQAQWDELVVSHGGRCAICETPSADLHIDHCHKGGQVRGLLCRRCNTGLGFFGDDMDRLVSALAYLIERG